MGLTDKFHKGDGGVESDDKKIVSSCVNLPSPMKPVILNSEEKGLEKEDEGKESPRTPICAKSKIPSKWVCPPAPKKPKTSSKFHNRAAMEFFQLPEDWETIFRLGVK
ncbi:unnamed protein product [Fraxinus pennsylvanica]|uniref:Uncharacterized protein n=1 Tax=Fraxinus pennsylvanica TaxID=56036 RepID=A0AAD1YRM6_9LAMI|nr:unnamed protein product [Fraxinus pennsylvanica]